MKWSLRVAISLDGNSGSFLWCHCKNQKDPKDRTLTCTFPLLAVQHLGLERTVSHDKFSYRQEEQLALTGHGHFSVNSFIVGRSTEAHSRYHLQGCSENNSLEMPSLASPWPPLTGLDSPPPSSKATCPSLYTVLTRPAAMSVSLESRGCMCLMGHRSTVAWHTVGTQLIRQWPQISLRGTCNWQLHCG